MDQDLIAYLDERFRESAQQLASFRDEINGRLDENNRRLDENNGRLGETNGRLGEAVLRIERLEEGVRHTQIMVEGVRGEVRLVAEGVATFDEKLDALRSVLREEIGEVKILLHQSYRDLDRRIG